MDFNVEENGLWVIYATAESNHTHVAKVSVRYIFVVGIFYGTAEKLIGRTDMTLLLILCNNPLNPPRRKLCKKKPLAKCF